ncbi:hypothetical protein G9H61_10750 [Aquirufa ecclesiirivi]|uniref:Uncharacterized protein n=1 Tax=Aquirufa ecclesiirivi TaxID=2715124 RepID=A0ABT4JI20_9BACT|nr:hypothetical protein [Aquirufa ecclesiirivi]MCZ2475929.1 hypothetical protein [Aquirufa ecclesiirivi]
MKKSNYIFIGFLFSLMGFSQFSRSQNLLVHSDWKSKVQIALTIVEKMEPSIYEDIIKKTTIQAGQLSKINAVAFANQEIHDGQKILWIMLDADILNRWPATRIASTIYHEALHHQYWDTYRSGIQSEQSLNKEHELIFNQVLSFLKKLNSVEDQTYQLSLMKELKIKVYQ